MSGFGGLRTLRLARPDDVDGFFAHLRWLLHADVAPEAVAWQVGSAPEPELFDGRAAELPPDTLPPGPPRTLPRACVELLRSALLNADTERFRRAHRYARRVAAERATWDDRLDPERVALERLAKQARREIHKLHAFVRFRPVSDDDGTTRHVAWIEPAHPVLRTAAPHFVRRFAALRWAILTPEGSIEWDGTRLHDGPGAERADAPPADAGEALWLAYYRSIFNPARIKVAMMKREMPLRFWPALPETAQIGALLQEAPVRAQRMAEAVQVGRARRAGRLPEPAVDAAPTDPPTDPLEALARDAALCLDCPWAAESTQTVFGQGRARAALMLVGEQPGDREDLDGRPFVGPAGQLLRGALAELNWPADALYVTNAVKHFKFEWRGKRRMHKTPGQRDVERCERWLEAEIAAVRPRALVALGATAARALLGRAVPINANAGRWFEERADGLAVLVVQHPSALLRTEGLPGAIDRDAWVALLARATPVIDAAR